MAETLVTLLIEQYARRMRQLIGDDRKLELLMDVVAGGKSGTFELTEVVVYLETGENSEAAEPPDTAVAKLIQRAIELTKEDGLCQDLVEQILNQGCNSFKIPTFSIKYFPNHSAAAFAQTMANLGLPDPELE